MKAFFTESECIIDNVDVGNKVLKAFLVLKTCKVGIEFYLMVLKKIIGK